MKIFTLRLPNSSFPLKNLIKKIPAAFAARLVMMMVLCMGVGKSWGQTTYTWNCSTTASSTGTDPNITSAAFNSTQGNNNGTTTLITTTSPSSGYSGATGTSNFGAACRVGALSTATSTYFSLVVTPVTNYQITLNSISLGSRGTSTGPTAITIYSSIDNYTSPIGSASVLANSIWALSTIPTFTGSLTGAVSTAVTLRIYGSGGAGSPSANTANWRIDDISLSVTATAPGIPTFSFGGTLTTFSTLVGTPSAQQSYTISGLNLTPNQTNGISVTAPADFEVSLTSNTFTGTNGNTVNLSSNGSGNIVGEPVSVYVRYFPSVPGSVSTNIAHSGAGVSPAQNQAVSGVSTAYYYSKATGDLTDVATWGTATDGTGTSPADFTSNNQTFEIRNRATVTIPANWTVSGTLSKIVVGSGTDFFIPSTNTVTGTVDVQNGGELTLENTTLPTLGTLAGGSTVEYAQTGTVSILNTTTDLVTYSNLKLSNSGLKTFKGSTTTVTGNLTYDGSTNGPLSIEAASALPFTTVTLAGNLTYLGAVTNPVDVNSYTLVTNGTGSQTITGNGNTARFFRITNSTAGNNVILSTVGGTTNALVGNATGGGISLGNGTATLVLNGNSLTFFAGTTTVTGAGSITGSSSSNIIINSTSTSFGTLNFTSGSRSLNNLSLTTVSGATLGTALDIYGTLSLTTASLNLNAQNLTLKSNATNTARIADLSGSTLTGATNVTMERYIKLRAGGDGRAYRLLSPTVNTTGSIQANWMEGGMNTAVGTNVNPVPLFGTQITGAGGNTNGFDKTQSNASSLYLTTNALVPTYTAVTSTTGTLNALTGYFMYVRGDRSMDMTIPLAPNMPTSSTTLRTTGTLVQGTQTSFTNALLPGSGVLNLVTNPYPSAINWAQVYAASTDISDSYTFWDPNFGTRGGFVTVNTAGTASSGAATQFIQSGQAFFVQSANGNTPTISIQEGHKAVGNNNDVFLVPPPPVESFRTELYFTEPNGFRRIADGVIAVYNDNYSAAIDAKDAVEINNWDENIAIAREGKKLAIETRPVIGKTDDLPIFMNNMKQQAYEFEFTPAAFTNTNLKAELVDNFLNTRTPLSVTAPTVVQFSVTADPASKATDRFKVVFGAEVKPLPDAAPVKTALTVYPNPVQGNNFKVDLTSLAKGNYLLRLYDNTGTIVHSEQFLHDGSQVSRTVNLKSTIAPGMYQLQLNNEKGFKSSQKIFKQ